MRYFEGFIAPVPRVNREAYGRQAKQAAPIFHEFGVDRHVEAWASDVPDGKVTSFRMAVNAWEDEDVVFSWFEYPDRATRDAANQLILTDPRMRELSADMPFDARRMIFGGFEGLVERGQGRGGYFDGFVTPVPEASLGAYRELGEKAAGLFEGLGVLRVVEANADDISSGQELDFYRAVKAENGETVVFSFFEWPDKEARDEGWKRVVEGGYMKPQGGLPFDGRRKFWGGFEPILDSAKARSA
jgi:uncharacterized protein YbaA (DUF1428 family)